MLTSFGQDFSLRSETAGFDKLFFMYLCMNKHYRDMEPGIHDMIFPKLNLSKEQMPDEIALLSAHQKLSEFMMEIEYFEKKYDTSFDAFEKKLKKHFADYEMENDWLAWKFAIDGKNYRTPLLNQAGK